MVLFFADAEKSLDRVKWFLMKETLYRMGLGPNMIVWIESVYKRPTPWIKTNNLSSKPLVLSRGVRQGCQLSRLLFDICMEAFALAIHQDEYIKGLICNGQQFKLAQYADDTAFCFRVKVFSPSFNG